MKLITLTLTMILLASCGRISPNQILSDFEQKAEKINKYERVALELSKESRMLKAQINRLKSEITELKAQNSFLALQVDGGKKPSRSIASVGPVDPSNDLVKFDTYQWEADKMLAVARAEFKANNFEKSAQFFKTFIEKYSKHSLMDDSVLFQAGVASYESGKYHDWAIVHLDQLIKEYPNSKYFRGAKLWSALTKLKVGMKKEFFATVEEFRLKYRNTNEWKILSVHYEKLANKYRY